MGSLKSCAKCRREISSRAKICPYCGDGDKPRATPFGKCWSCGTELSFYEHLYKRVSYTSTPVTNVSIRVEGNHVASSSSGGYNDSYYVYKKPCPKCGDPDPLIRRRDMARYSVLLWLMSLMVRSIVGMIPLAAAFYLLGLISCFHLALQTLEKLFQVRPLTAGNRG
jgi:RNA polymerase subunit RPABC4/transcription elongation factor Spt4